MVRTHTVVAGETLSALALRFYGDAELYRLIATASGIADPNVIDVGQRLIFPDFTRYTVVAGDTLSALCYQCRATADHPGHHETHGCRGGHAVGVGIAILW